MSHRGLKRYGLRGGEPLVRKDAPEIIACLGQLGIELAITTNGIRIDEMMDELIQANVKAINISLDTLEREKFLKITRRDLFDRVKRNIDLALQHQIRLKINVVVMKGLNENEILDFIELTRDNRLEIRFIEFMPFSGNRWTSNQVFTLQEILLKAAERYEIIPLPQEPNDTSKKYKVPGYIGSFAVISTMSEPFCGTCNRMRLTADGKLKNCLFSKGETDLLTALRNGEEILPLIQQNINEKAKALGGQFSGVFESIDTAALENRSMITIGG
ncbi:GTP 3',8-cyclase MoaA [Chryseobacterium camelliae]|uniref:Cyclic pyranopterin phosphate synthase n=1 Tax=Chryseobacterium camelliae TaxID=1265445 RepID=A0ABU0TFS2_9FLAO|nr:radical SAM protein [Chryseobacterium camelliae]MDQ1095908.1 cyclic pyranopterin phosphate synthase [Chryseobacterium camelliae]